MKKILTLTLAFVMLFSTVFSGNKTVSDTAYAANAVLDAVIGIAENNSNVTDSGLIGSVTLDIESEKSYDNAVIVTAVFDGDVFLTAQIDEVDISAETENRPVIELPSAPPVEKETYNVRFYLWASRRTLTPIAEPMLIAISSDGVITKTVEFADMQILLVTNGEDSAEITTPTWNSNNAFLNSGTYWLLVKANIGNWVMDKIIMSLNTQIAFAGAGTVCEYVAPLTKEEFDAAQKAAEEKETVKGLVAPSLAPYKNEKSVTRKSSGNSTFQNLQLTSSFYGESYEDGHLYFAVQYTGMRTAMREKNPSGWKLDLTLSSDKYHVITSPRTIPEEVFDGPYAENEWLTRYAPWMDNLHIRSQYEVDNDYYGGEANQQMRVLAMSPLDSDLMYVGSDTAGLYRTTDGGEHWFNINAINPTREAYWILCDKFERETVYILSRKIGLCRSRDMGETWEVIVKDTCNVGEVRRSGSIAQDEAGNTFIGVGSGVYRLDRETDTVENLFAHAAETDPMFKEIISLKGDNGIVCFDLDVSPDGMDIYAVVRKGTDTVVKGIYISRDGGKTWTVKSEYLGMTINCSSIALHPENKDEIYAAIQFTNAETEELIAHYVFYKTTDCFETLSREQDTADYKKENGKETGIPQLKATFGPKNAGGIYPLYYTGDLRAWPLRVSYDYGKTFSRFVDENSIVVNREGGFGINTPRNEMITGYQSQGFAPDMNVPGRVVFCHSGVYVKEADGKFYRINAGYGGANVDCIAFNSKNEAWMGTCDIGAYVTASGTWTNDAFPAMRTIDAAYNDDYVLAVFDPNNDNHLITHLGTSNSTPDVWGIRQSYDGGKNMQALEEGSKIPKEEITLGNPTVLQYDKNDPNTIYSSYSNSYDNGETWVKNEYVIAAISPLNDHKWVGRKGTEENCDLYYTEDAGKTWTFIRNYNMRKCTGFMLDGNNDDYFWFAGMYTLSRMNIKTGEVESFNSHFKDFPYFRSVKQNPKDYNHIIVTSYWGAGNPEKDWFLAESRDGGKTWNTVPGIWGSECRMILFPEHLDYAIIGTMGGLMIYRYEEFRKYQDSVN